MVVLQDCAGAKRTPLHRMSSFTSQPHELHHAVEEEEHQQSAKEEVQQFQQQEGEQKQQTVRRQAGQHPTKR